MKFLWFHSHLLHLSLFGHAVRDKSVVYFHLLLSYYLLIFLFILHLLHRSSKLPLIETKYLRDHLLLDDVDQSQKTA